MGIYMETDMCMIKKSLFLLGLTVAMPAVSVYADPVLIDGIYYELASGIAVVTNNGDPYSSYREPYVEIPAIVEYGGNPYVVEEIGAGAFSMSEIWGVVLPPTIRTIGDEAFRNCRRLDYLSLPESLAMIGSYAFEWCENLSFEALPTDVRMIGKCILADVVAIPALWDASAPIVGFMNKCSTTHGVTTPLCSKLTLGFGNESEHGAEGYVSGNILATHITGPVLVKNPQFLHYIVTRLFQQKGWEIPEALPVPPHQQESYAVTLRELQARVK